MECRIRNRHGDYRWMLGRALPSRNEQGEIIQWIGTYTDIHEHKLALERIDQAQRQLRDNNEQLTRVNVDLDNFIYTASHDLKAPITNIEGLLHALLRGAARRSRANRPGAAHSGADAGLGEPLQAHHRAPHRRDQAAEGARPPHRSGGFGGHDSGRVPRFGPAHSV